MNILLIAEVVDNMLEPASNELIAFARRLREDPTTEIAMLVPGQDVRDIGEAIARQGIDVLLIENEHLRYFNPEILLQEIAGAVDRIKPQFVCFLHSTRGCHLAPAVAVLTGSSCITAVEAIREGEALAFRRSLFSGKLLMEVSPQAPRSVVTILPGAFPAADEADSLPVEPGAVSVRQIDVQEKRVFAHGLRRDDSDNGKLDEADIIISAGRGIGSAENLSLIRDVSEILPRSAIGASRPVCDLGWLPYAHQVGTTGKTVSPRLYIACGISGTSQHIAGMRNSRWIVAINRDPQAAIFSIADYGVVEDVTTFLPLLTSTYDKLFGK